MDIAKISAHHHRLVIAQNIMKPAPRLLGLSFQAMQQPHQFGNLAATVDQVTDQDQVALSPNPVSLLINELVDQLVVAIKDGRTNPGPNQSNEGWPATFHARVLAEFPELKNRK